MKASSILGLASLATNVGLLTIIALGAFNRSASKEPAPTQATVSRPQPETKNELSSEAWPALVSTDLQAERVRLEAAGFPPVAIRAIIAAQIREGFAARRKAIDANLANAPFWKPSIPDPQAQAELRAISKEEQKALKAVLGPDPTFGPAARLQRQFPNLAPEKVDQLVAIRERYDEQRQEIAGYGRGPMSPSEREKYNALEKAMHTEFAGVLTPEEIENYDLRTSNVANNIRSNLQGIFEPTESEFRTLFRLQTTFEGQLAYTGVSTPELDRTRSEARKQLNDQIAAALGPNRYAEYQRANDYNYQQTSRLISRLGLPVETTNSLYAVQKEFEERRNAIYSGTNASNRDQLAQTMTTLQQEATARITTVLGGNAGSVEAYKQYGGSWVRDMVPRTPPVAAAKK